MQGKNSVGRIVIQSSASSKDFWTIIWHCRVGAGFQMHGEAVYFKNFPLERPFDIPKQKLNHWWTVHKRGLQIWIILPCARTADRVFPGDPSRLCFPRLCPSRSGSTSIIRAKLVKIIDLNCHLAATYVQLRKFNKTKSFVSAFCNARNLARARILLENKRRSGLL